MLWLLVAACSPAAPPAVPVHVAPVAVPVVVTPTAPPPAPFHERLLLDAGHGAPKNLGNTNAEGEREADVTRRITDAVYDALHAHGDPVTRTRPDAELVPYDRRLTMTQGADLFLSIHTDSRAGLDRRTVDAAAGTWTNTGAAGFAVLWSDEGASALVEGRHAWARALAVRLAQAGFHPYAGADYTGLYAPDATAGVFVDRHVDRKRIMLLRRPRIRSLILETHEAHDLAEVAAWKLPATWDALAGAVEASVRDVAATPTAAR